jgi:hypothetical protein
MKRKYMKRNLNSDYSHKILYKNAFIYNAALKLHKYRLWRFLLPLLLQLVLMLQACKKILRIQY